jgi:heptosyltransferase-3
MLAADSRVLVVTVARIGDTLLATPVMRALRHACPRGRLTVLAHPKRTEALQHLPFIDRLGSIDKLRAPFRGRLAGPAHDVALVYGRDAELVDYALRVSGAVIAFDEPAFRARARTPDERLTLVPPASGMHAVHERFRLAEVLGVTPGDGRLAWEVTPQEKAAALRQRPRTQGPVIALQMSSFPTKAHRDWPVAQFIELAAGLMERHADAHFVVLGDAHASDASSGFMRAFPERTLLAAGHTTLREAAALISVCDLYVGVDTGPTHIAGALRVPMVALYHRDYPGRNLVPLGHPRCRMLECAGPGMDSITVADVREVAMLSAGTVTA